MRQSKMLGLMTAVAVTVAATAGIAAPIALKSIGQPAATGMIQKEMEAPFFEDFAARTGTDVQMSFQPLDQTGIKDAEGLRLLKTGLFDFMSLRLQQVSRDAPVLFGLDMVGQNGTYDDVKASVDGFAPFVNKTLEDQFAVKMLGYWAFGPQVLFCKPEIAGLKDLSGLKVRTDDQNLANFISSLGGIPVTMGFADVHQSLARGVVDCAITGPSSANSAAWPEETTTVLPLGFKSAVQGYGVSRKAWDKFSPEDQQKIQTAFDKLTSDINAYSQKLWDDAMRCNAGETPCELNKPYKLKQVPVSDADRQAIKDAVAKVSFPAFAQLCDKSAPGCSDAWKQALGARFGM